MLTTPTTPTNQTEMMQKRNKKNTSHHSWSCLICIFRFLFLESQRAKRPWIWISIYFFYVKSMHFTDVSMNLFLICLFVFSSLCWIICSSLCLTRIDMDNNKRTMAHLWARIWCWLYGASFELSRHSSILVRTQFVEGTRRNCAYVSRTLPANTKRYVNLLALISMWEHFAHFCFSQPMRHQSDETVFFHILFRSVSLSLCQMLLALLLAFIARIAIALYDF